MGGGDLTLSALLDLLMVAFGAAGMDGAVRNQAAATGTQPVPYVGQLLNRYLETALDSVLPAVWGKRISDGLSILANGTLYLDSDATAAVADFQRWTWTDGGLSEYAPVVDGADGLYTVGGINCRLVSVDVQRVIDGQTLYYYDSPLAMGSTVNYYLGSVPAGARYFVFAASYNGGHRFYAAPFNEYSCVRVQVYRNNSAEYYGPFPLESNKARLIMALNPTTNGSYSVGDIPVNADVGDAIIPFDVSAIVAGVVGDVNTFIGPMQQEQGTQLPLGDAVTVSSDTAATMHLLNYLRATAAAYAGTGTAQVPVTDVGTGEDELLPLSVPLDTPIGVTGVSDVAIDQTGAEAGTDAVAGDFAGTDDFTMDLTQFFPFCIPFDIYALYEKFEAEAEAPVIDWPIPVPGQEQPTTIHLDFSVFDSLAVWVRRLELIAFAVGLMFLTKHLIQGGD